MRESKQRVMLLSNVFSDTIDEKEKLAPRKSMVCDTSVSPSKEIKCPLTIPMVIAKRKE
jgi:hypothetical protein